MLTQVELDPHERREIRTELEKVHRHGFWFAAGWLLLAAALGAGAWYIYPILKNHEAAFTQIGNIRESVVSIGDQLKRATAAIEAQSSDQQTLRGQVNQLARTMQMKMEVAAKQASASSEELYSRLQARIDEKLNGVETRVSRLESSSDTQQTRLADLQRQLGEARDEIAKQADQLSAVQRQAEQTGADHARQLAALRQDEDSARQDVDSIQTKLSVRRVDFEVTKNHSRQLGDGVSLDVTGTDVAHRTVSGWMWLLPERRTTWLRGQNAQSPVVFYGQQDGRKRELVITNVTYNGVTGYLLVPGDRTETTASRSE